ncbi:fibronectin type III-like domain-contianing protein [Botrimarina sp.]|uniref:fibronectin type III-like domain-contianing protein n=1 Tax=Botrimarina sp. TaxID=2795802 RepID=UPI0032EDCB87
MSGKRRKFSASITARVAVDAAREVAQLYVGDVASSLVRPELGLKAFEKASLKPGESAPVEFTLGEDALAYCDDQPGAWVVEPGRFAKAVGASSRDTRLREHVELSVDGSD